MLSSTCGESCSVARRGPRPVTTLPGDERFAKGSRLLRRPEYLRVQRGGRKLHTRSLLILVKPNRLGRTRLGIAVSRKFGNSVHRNHAKRLVREVFRRNRSLFPGRMDLVVIPKRTRHRCDYHSLVQEISGLDWRRPA